MPAPPTHAGNVIAWIGTAMFAAFTCGASVGTTGYNGYGFIAIAGLTCAAPFLTLPFVIHLRSVTAQPRGKGSLTSIVASVWFPGLGAAVSSIGFGPIITFPALLFVERGWNMAWLVVTAFAVALIIARVTLGHLSDRIGGARVALLFVIIETIGQALMWLAPVSAVALFGAALTGLGYSLVYPGFGVEVIRRAPPEARGVEMGAYTAFLDLALGITSPVLGFIGSTFGIESVFLASSIMVLGAAGVAIRLLVTQSQKRREAAA